MANVASVCADATDFTTDDSNGRLKLNPHFRQNDVEAFTFTLNGAQNVFEQVTTFDDVIVPVSGYYILNGEAHGNATITSATPGTVVVAECSFQLRRNNSPIAGTETMLISNQQGSSSVDQPALQLHGSGSCTRAVFLNAGDRISIWAKRNSDAGTTTEIISDDRGRCRVTLVRFGGA